MQENEFEKQVQQKMDDLKLDPSAAVWQKIESQIKKDKPRRRIFILLPILFIGVLYGGYVFFNNNNNIENNKPDQLQSPASENKNTITSKTPVTKQSIDSITLDQAVLQKETIVSPDKSYRTLEKRKVNARLKVNIENNSINGVYEPVPKKQITENISTAKAGSISNEKIKTDSKNIEQQNDIAEKEFKSNTISIQAEELIKQNEQDSLSKSINIKNDKISIEEKIVAANNKNPSLNKWKWGATLTIGVAGMSNSFFGDFLGDEQKSDPVFQNIPSGSGSGGFNQAPAPSKIKPALAFITGISAERNITNKIFFTTGLNYKLFTTTTRVGADSSAFYRASNAVNKYSNRFHYLELPVALKWQVADLKRSKLYFNTGFSISQLIRASALQLNTSTRLYYHDNSLFNKTQFGFNTALDLAFLSKENRSIIIGPYVNYGINKLASKGYNNHHLTFVGIRSQIIFGRK